MTHTGVLAQNVHGAAQCFVAYCCRGAARLGGHVYPDITVDYIGFGHTMAAARSGDVQRVREIVGRSVSQLCRAGADFFVCADNTAHLALDLPGEELDLPGLHLVDLVAQEASRLGHRRVGLLGTAMLVGSDLYPRWFGAQGISCVRPGHDDRQAMDAVILGELVNGVRTDRSRRRSLEVVDRLVGQGCDAIALVSTELPWLLEGQRLPVPVLDSAEIAARAALDVALGDRPLPTWRGGPHLDLLSA